MSASPPGEAPQDHETPDDVRALKSSLRSSAVQGELFRQQLHLLADIRCALLLIGGSALAFQPRLWAVAAALAVGAVLVAIARRNTDHGNMHLVVAELIVSFLLLSFILYDQDEGLSVALLAESSAGGLLLGAALGGGASTRKVFGYGSAFALAVGGAAAFFCWIQNQRWEAALPVTAVAALAMISIGLLSTRRSQRAGASLAAELDDLETSAELLSIKLFKARVAKEEAQRVVHDNLLPLYHRAASGHLDHEDRDRFTALYLGGRSLLEDRTRVEGLTDAINQLTYKSARLGLQLEVLESVARPPHPDILKIVTDVVGTLLGNVARHAGVPVAQLSLRTDDDSNGLIVALVDHGSGFDPESVRWSPATEILVLEPVRRNWRACRRRESDRWRNKVDTALPVGAGDVSTVRTVAIVEDQQGFAFDPVSLFNRIGWKCVASYFSIIQMEEAATSDKTLAGDVIVVDLHLGGRPSGYSAVERALALQHKLGLTRSVVTVSQVTNRRSITDAWAAGASTFVSRQAVPDALWARVLAAARSEQPYFTACLAAHLLQDRNARKLDPELDLGAASVRLLSRAQDSGDLEAPPYGYPWDEYLDLAGEIRRTAQLRSRTYRIQLTEDQQVVAKLVTMGLSQEQIASILVISSETVAYHLRKIRQGLAAQGIDLPGASAAREAWSEWCAQECVLPNYVPEKLQALACEHCGRPGGRHTGGCVRSP